MKVRAAGAAAVVGLLAAWLLFDHAYRRGGDRPVAWRDASGALGPVELERPTMRVFRDHESLERFGVRLPVAIDFGRNDAVLVSPGPRSSTAYGVVVRSIRKERGRIVVTVRERSPSRTRSGRARVTYPYRLLTIPATDKSVTFSWEGR